MLIQITNKCLEGCGHCMQNSTPDGAHMNRETLMRALEFGRFIGVSIYVISGGEPTLHPEFYDFCRAVNNHCKVSHSVWTVTSNGSWYPERAEEIGRLALMSFYCGMQVNTDKKWYSNYDRIKENEIAINSVPKVMVTEGPIHMQDLGRARHNAEAQAEVASNRFHMSCCNSHLMFKQSVTPGQVGSRMLQRNLVCKPLVSVSGDVHASESALCPSFGNVNADGFATIFDNVRNGRPCYGCALGQKFLTSSNPKIVAARTFLNRPAIQS